MKNFKILKNIFLCLIFLLTFSGSCERKPTVSTITQDSVLVIQDDSIFVFGQSAMKNQFERNFTHQQFDSICRVDKISNNLNEWYVFASRDAETKEPLAEYMFIKDLGLNECIYRLIKNDDGTYHITKRVIYFK